MSTKSSLNVERTPFGSIILSYEDLKVEISESEWSDLVHNKPTLEAERIAWQLLFNRNGFPAPSPDKRNSKTNYVKGTRGNPAGPNSGGSTYDNYEKWAREYQCDWDPNPSSNTPRGSDKVPNYGWGPDPAPKKPKPEDVIMANKFLPFIVEKSAPDHIYRTLLQRSKGMNIKLVTSIFWLVADKGITELREFVKTLPDNSTVSQMYEEMLGKYSEYQIFDEELNLYISVGKHFCSEDWSEINSNLTKDFDPADIMAFLFVMNKLKAVDAWSNYDFDSFFQQTDLILSEICKYVTFSDKGEIKAFDSAEDLKAFIIYSALTIVPDSKGTPENPIKAVIVESENDTPR